ncbi:MAG: flagellar FlbD family protein [Acidobacteria bacterium]|nr:flagellar FlbD family protein [Acidobacteriota bacterium]MBI3662967.1 flagellar FlbD family protein [Acidobacteriota bacterium]
MIELTRLNHNPLVLNADLVKYVENSPDTVITLVTGEKIIVSETLQQVVMRIFDYRRKLLAGLTPADTGAALHSASVASLASSAVEKDAESD